MAIPFLSARYYIGIQAASTHIPVHLEHGDIQSSLTGSPGDIDIGPFTALFFVAPDNINTHLFQMIDNEFYPLWVKMKMDDFVYRISFSQGFDFVFFLSVLDHRLCCYVTMIVIEHEEKDEWRRDSLAVKLSINPSLNCVAILQS